MFAAFHRDHTCLMGAGLPVANTINSRVEYLSNGDRSTFKSTKVTRIPTPADSVEDFSPFKFISSSSESGLMSKTAVDPGPPVQGDKESPFVKVPDTSHGRQRRHRGWRVYKWFKHDRHPREKTEDEEFEIATGLRRIPITNRGGIDQDFIMGDSNSSSSGGFADSEESTLLGEDSANRFRTARITRERCSSAQYSFINFKHFQDSGLNGEGTGSSNTTTYVEQRTPRRVVQNDSRGSAFSFEYVPEETKFRTSALGDTKKKKEGLITRLHRSLRGSVRHRYIDPQPNESDNEDDDDEVVVGIVKKADETNEDQLESSRMSLRHRLTEVSRLFPFRSHGNESVLSGYLAQSPEKDLTERYLGDNGTENLEADLARLDNDAKMDIFGRLTPVKAEREGLKRKRSLKSLFMRSSGGQTVKETTSVNQWVADIDDDDIFQSKEIRGYGSVRGGSQGTGAAATTTSIDPYTDRGDGYMPAKRKRSQQQVRHTSLNELIKQRAEHERATARYEDFRYL